MSLLCCYNQLQFNHCSFLSSMQAPWHKRGQHLPVDWPSKGHIEFDDLCLRYRPGLDLVLRGVNFEVQPGEKVGVSIQPAQPSYVMMTSSNGNMFRVTGPSCGEFTGHRWIPHTKARTRGSLMFSMISAWMNGWKNNWKTDDLRRHGAHHDVTVM